jgi:UDPglucose--hexose-1-phosphate uridylyltransferase
MRESEMRLDPLRQTWTIFSRSRALSPQFARASKNGDKPNPSPFAAGSEQLTPKSLHEEKSASGDAWQVRVIPNRIPALRVEGREAIASDGFYDHMDALGAHEIIIEDPGDRQLDELALPAVEQVLHAWKVRMLDLFRDVRLRAFFVVKNVGEPAGARFPHSLSQLVAMAVIPPALKQKLTVARDFYEHKKRSIFEDILSDEVRAGSRLVYENNGFAAFCPYASRTPFEQAIYPKRQCADFHGVTHQEISQLADVLKTSLRKLNRALDHPAYNLLLITAPTRSSRRDHWNTIERDFRWHIEIVPRLNFSGGLELGTGCDVNSVWPESAAEHLRKISL